MHDKLARRHFLGAVAAAGGAALRGIAAEGRAGTPGSVDWIVDSHVHLRHGNATHSEYSPDTIVETMDAVGIDKSVVFAICTTTRRSIEMAEAAVKKYPERLIPYVYALPHYERPVIREIEEVLSAGMFRGVKIHAGECTLGEWVVDPVLEVAGKYGAPCLIDCLGNYPAARRIARSFPRTKMIVAHMGRFLSTDKQLLDQFIGLAEEFSNVHLDLSGVVIVEKIVEAVERIGSARMLWGTDGPDKQPDTFTYARKELGKIRRLNLSEEDKANLLGRTACKLLKL